MTGRSPRRARLVALEGIDGAGKSSLGRALASRLRRAGYTVRLRREPTDPALGALAQKAGARDPWTGAIYFTVDRHQARPALEEDLRASDVVLTDRSYFSTLAYQGSALSSEERRRLERLQRRATVVPDQVLLLDLPVARALPRVGARATRSRAGLGPLERRRTLVRVAKAYRTLSRRPGWTVLDARLTKREVVRQAFAALRLPAPRRKGNRYPPSSDR